MENETINSYFFRNTQKGESMDYGNFFSEAWDLIWKHKFLILLGVLVALGSAGGGGGSQGISAGNFNAGTRQMPQFDFDPTAPFHSLDIPYFAVGGIIILVLFLILIGLVFWLLGTISRGGLIHGANLVSQGKESDFSDSFRAGWSKVLRLIGIGIVPAIPVLLLVVISISSIGIYGEFRQVISHGEIIAAPRTGLLVPIGILACLLVPLALALSLLRTFANRACMLENLGVFASYQRGARVLFANFGNALILFLLQIALSIGIMIVLFVPAILLALCCFLWPVLLLVQGTFTAFYSTLWTLAWNHWTDTTEVKELETA